MAKKRSFVFWGGLGCLSLLLLCAGGGVAVITATFTAMKHSTPYQESVARLRADSKALSALGEPVETGWMVSGSVNADLNGGHAALAIPVHGPNASGVLQVEANRIAKLWTYQTMNLVLDGSKKEINLLSSDDAVPPKELKL